MTQNEFAEIMEGEEAPYFRVDHLYPGECKLDGWFTLPQLKALVKVLEEPPGWAANKELSPATVEQS